ncbi:flagellar hook-length control protein FliK [Halalkalibacter urbisdiaboli]|uniref:flagellar hook-length control protein FliK n=1 Tax=Halalkalibacter urbisdiaboli TaxID=1960589 RepID=UPI000B4324ED|nr:flagellar hook-length control protein FliK [Halalkalibacter urbisdiaboli]
MNSIVPLIQANTLSNTKSISSGTKANHSAGSVQGDSSFLSLFNGLVAQQESLVDVESSSSQSEDLLSLLLGLGDENLFFNENLLYSEDVTALLELLPQDWESLFTQFLSNEQGLNAEELNQLPLEQQGILALLTLRQQDSIDLPPKRLEALQQFVNRIFPFLSEGKFLQDNIKLEKFVEHVKLKLEKNPNANGNSTSFTQLLQEREEPQKPLTIQLANEPTKLRGLQHPNQEFGQVMTKAEQATIHLGEQVSREVRQQQFIKQFQQLLQRSIFTQQQDGTKTLSIKLYPAHLGRLDIQLTQLNGAIVAKILTGTSTTKELVESQLTQLRHAFAQQQLNVDRIEVAEQQLQDQKEEHSQKREDRYEDNSSDNNEEIEERVSFQDALEDATFNQQV